MSSVHVTQSAAACNISSPLRNHLLLLHHSLPWSHSNCSHPTSKSTMSPPNLSHLLSQHPILSSIVESLSTLDLHNLSLTNRTNHLYIHGTRNPINTYFASTQCAGQSSTRIRLSNMAKLGQLRGWIGSIIPPLAAKNPLCEGKSRFRCRKCHVPVCRSCAPRLSYVQRQDHNLENGTIDVLSRRYVLRLELPLAYAHGDHLSYARISDSESRIVKEHRRRHFCSSPSSCASSASTLSSQGGSTAATKPDQVLVHEQKPRRQPTHMCKCEDLNYHALGWNVFSKWELCWDCGTSIGEGDAKSRPKYGDKCFARGGKDKVTGRYKKGPTVGFVSSLLVSSYLAALEISRG